MKIEEPTLLSYITKSTNTIEEKVQEDIEVKEKTSKKIKTFLGSYLDILA